MDSNLQPQGSATMATVGGTLLVMLLQIDTGEILKTSCLAAIGATVSFIVSMALKWLVRKRRLRKKA